MTSSPSDHSIILRYVSVGFVPGIEYPHSQGTLTPGTRESPEDVGPTSVRFQGVISIGHTLVD